MAILDIVVTHYNETREIYQKYFDLLRNQRGIDFDDIHVIIVNDGDGRIDDDLLSALPCTTEQHNIPKAGISAARNFGLKQSTAEWISFCDCDDCYSSVYSLKLVMDLLTDRAVSSKYDMMWSHLCAEDKSRSGGGLKLISRGLDLVFIHGKFYRRQFLVDHDIWFPETLEFNEDSAFNAIANTHWDYHRIGEIKTAFPLYSWCFRPGSLTGTPGNLERAILGSYMRNKLVVDEFEKRLPHDRYCAMVARAIFDTYYVLNVERITPMRRQMLDDFKVWYAEHKQAFQACPYEMLKEVKAVSKAEHEAGMAEESERWPGQEPNPCKQEISVTKWLASLEEDG